MVKVLGIEWDGTGHSWHRLGMIGGKTVAEIRKLKNHTHSNSDNWQVEIDGIVLPEKFRAVRDAQVHAAHYLEENGK